MDTPDSKNPDGREINRRRLLQFAAASGAIAVAGCSDGGTPSNGTEPDGGAGAPVDDALVVDVGGRADEAVYAPYSSTLTHLGGLRPIEASFAHFGRTRWDGTREGWLLADHWAEDGTIFWQMRDDFEWSNGDPVVAEDLAAKFWLDHYQSVVGDNVEFENVQIQDDYTVSFDLTNPDISPDIYFGEWMGFNSHIWPRRAYLDVKADVVSEWTEKLHDATTRDEVSSIWTDFDTWSIPNEEMPRNGPFDYAGDVAGRVHRYVGHGGYPGLAHIGGVEYPTRGIDWELHMKPYSSAQVRMQAFLSQRDDDVDYVRVNSMDVWESGLDKGYVAWPADLEVLQESVTLFGGVSGYQMNWTREPLDDFRVRKALLNVVPTSFGSRAYGNGYMAVNYPSGLPRPVAESYLGQDWIESNLEPAAVESPNTDRAEELLEQAGLTKESGQWRLPDGSTWTVDLKSPTYEERVKQAQVAVDQLESFGINVEMTAVENTNLEATVLPEGNYDLVEAGWGSLGHPYNSYSTVVQDVAAAKEGGQEVVAPYQTEEWSVPMPIGDPEGDVENVNVYEELQKLRTESGDTEERVKLIAWAVNQAVPNYFWSNGYRAQPPVAMVDGNQWLRPEGDEHVGYGSISEYASCQAKWGIRPKQASG